MARQNPVVSKVAGPLPGLGAELPMPMGSSPQVWEPISPDMTKNDGDGPSIPDAPFANGSDNRNKSGAPSTPVTGLGL